MEVTTPSSTIQNLCGTGGVPNAEFIFPLRDRAFVRYPVACPKSQILLRISLPNHRTTSGLMALARVPGRQWKSFWVQ